MKLVSVIIPTYNRFQYLQNTLESVKLQTYKNIEIIVVNDRSTQEEYYKYNWEENGIKIIHLENNSKKTFGFACPGGYQRNFGIDLAKGEYIAFCDDDDIWFPQKLEKQIEAMQRTGCKMSSTEGLHGRGVFDPRKTYGKYNSEIHIDILRSIFRKKNYDLQDFPEIWTKDFVKIHNCMICSSVILEREIIDKTGKFIVAKTGEDYEYWLRALKFTSSVYVSDASVYYDAGHGAGQNY